MHEMRTKSLNAYNICMSVVCAHILEGATLTLSPRKRNQITTCPPKMATHAIQQLPKKTKNVQTVHELG